MARKLKDDILKMAADISTLLPAAVDNKGDAKALTTLHLTTIKAIQEQHVRGTK